MTHIAWHRNGRGRILGVDAHVTHDSYLSPRSEVSGPSVIAHSTLVEARVDNCHIAESSLMAVFAFNSTIVGADIERSLLTDCIVNSLHGKRPSCSKVKLTDVIVEGDACLVGPWELDGNVRIPTGEWHRPPRHLHIAGDDVDAYLTESTDGHALIACMRKPVTQWLKCGPRLGRILGWPPDFVASAHRFMEMLADQPLATM